MQGYVQYTVLYSSDRVVKNIIMDFHPLQNLLTYKVLVKFILSRGEGRTKSYDGEKKPVLL
jgi:hypothetical protein